MKYPQNKIQENKYTSGGEFVEKNSNRDFKGSYHIIGNQYFIGAKFKANADEIIKKTGFLNKVPSSTVDYSFLKNNQKLISPNNLPSFNFDPNPQEIKNGVTNRYFVKKLNNNPILIKEVSKSDYNTYVNDPFYQIISIQWNIGLNNDKNIEDGNKKMDGLKQFLT
jgi:hypothetical protein